MKKCFLILWLLPFLSIAQNYSKKVSALFLGNSYTYVNNLPLLIYDIALANGDTLVYDSNTPGGYTFNNHFNDLTSKAKINASPWKYVILQAQSQEPSFSPSQVNSQTLPNALKLDSLIKINNACTNTVFYETWGRKNGDASNCAVYPPVCSYFGMQNRLKQSYKKFADTCNAVMSPIGEAFRKSIALNPLLELYQLDESHPSLEGSYLAACVFYEVLFQKSVLSNTFISTINTSTATFLQQIAHAVVNDSLAVWNIGKNLPWADFSFNGIAGLNYQFYSQSPGLNNKWFFGDAITSTLVSPNHNYLSTGTYTISHVVKNNCKTDSVSKVVLIAPSSISQNNHDAKISIFPNPSSSFIKIDNAINFENNNSFIEIRNMLGQLVYSSSYSKTINIKDFVNGIYSLKLFTNEASFNFHFIKND